MNIEIVLKQLLHDQCHEHLMSVELLPTKFNSTIYKLTTDKGSTYIVKQYIRRSGDHRDRLSTEFYGLTFLWSHGIRVVPEPIVYSKSHQIGVYRFVNGKKLKSNEVQPEHIHQSARFLKSLYTLAKANGTNELPIASEAYFTIGGLMKLIEIRRKHLRTNSKKGEVTQKLYHFLDDEFLPIYKELLSYVMSECKHMRIDVGRPIRRNQMTLSPSDFGFHNAIQRDDESLVFLDFEYFGWDDPAKMISDFFLHPAMSLPLEYRSLFLKNLHVFFDDDPTLVKRLPLIYLLLGLKWPLIMLNPFIRDEAKYEEQEMQLTKAKVKLAETFREYQAKVFPIMLLQ